MPAKRPDQVRIGKTNVAILDGSEDLSLWSEEELVRGQRKSRRGTWEGSKPNVVPASVHQELTKRRFSRAFELLREDLVGAVETLTAIRADEDAPYKDRIKAAELILHYTVGKPVERVQVESVSEEPKAYQRAWMSMLMEQYGSMKAIMEAPDFAGFDAEGLPMFERSRRNAIEATATEAETE